MLFDKVTQLIGNTPILRLPLRKNQWQLLLKLEKFNPGQSMKDRMARNMIDDAEKGCVAKTEALDGKVRDCVRSLLSPCPNQTRLSGVITNPKSSCCAFVGT